MHAIPLPLQQATNAWIATRHAGAAPRQRVLMTADTSSHVWQYALELSRALIADGHEVALATTGGMPDTGQRLEAEAIEELELHPSAYKPSTLDHCVERRAAGRWLLDLAATVRPSVLHLNGFDFADLPWKTPVLLAAHTCVQSWWRAVHGTPPPESWRWCRHRIAAALRTADFVVTPTRAILHGLQRHHGPLRAARVIPNGRDRVSGSVSAKGAYVYSSGYPGDRGENLAVLAAAAARVSWPVCVATRGERPGDAADSLEGVRMLEHRSCRDAATWLARAPVYALPALHAPAGMSVLDAALARCALVLGDIEGLRETWDGAAVFVDPGDGEALAHALQQLIDDETTRERRAEQACMRARQFSASAMASAYAAAYAEAASVECAAVEFPPAESPALRC